MTFTTLLQGASRRWETAAVFRIPGILVLTLWGAAACYHPQGVDPRVLMNELREPIAGATVGTLARDRGSPTAQSSAILSEDRSVALALVWNRDLRAFRLSQGIAEGEVVSAGALANPEVRFELTHIQQGSLDNLGWDLRLTWEPPRPVVRAGRVAAAEARVDEFRRELNEREWDVACDVRTAYAVLQAEDDEIHVAQDAIGNRRRLAEATGKRMQRGGTTRLDLDLVHLSLAAAEHIESQQHLARTLAANTLVRLMGGQAPGNSIAVTGTLPDGSTGPVAAPSRNALENMAVANRPAVAAALAHHRAAEETLRAETAARWPWFRLSSAPRVRRKESIGADIDWGVGVDVILPLLDTNRGHIQSATAARDTARAAITGRLADLRAEIDRALSTWEEQRSILLRLQNHVAPLLAEHDRILAIAAQAAELDLPSLIASENLVLESRVQLITARLGVRKAWIALERAVGTNLSQGVGQP